MNIENLFDNLKKVSAGLVCGFALTIFGTALPVFAATIIDEIVITATRMEEKGFDVPTPIETVSAETLTINSPATAAQSLAELPGVSISGAGLWSTRPVIRGFGGNRVLALIDGNRENNLWAGRSPLIPFIDAGYVVGRDRKSHDRLNDIPPLNGILGARWHDQLANGLNYWFEFSGNFFDSQDHPAKGEKETPGYSFFNLRSGIKFDYAAFKNITLTLNIENLFDKKYRNHLNKADFYNNPGLNVITSLKFSF